MTDLSISYNRIDAPAPILSTNSQELSRLLSAAVVSPGFRKSLLRDPQSAIANGYQGESFQMSLDEWNCILSIKAQDLPSLANQILAYHTRKHYFEELQISQDCVGVLAL